MTHEQESVRLWDRLEVANLLLERVNEDEAALYGRRVSARKAIRTALADLDAHINPEGGS